MTPRLVRWRSLARFGVVLALLAAPADARPCRLQDAEALLEARKTREARQLLEDCLAGDPRDGKAAYFLGRAHWLDRNQDGAVRWLERAAALEPGNSDYQLWLGRAYGAQAIRANVLKQPALARKVRRAFERSVEN